MHARHNFNLAGIVHWKNVINASVEASARPLALLAERGRGWKAYNRFYWLRMSWMNSILCFVLYIYIQERGRRFHLHCVGTDVEECLRARRRKQHFCVCLAWCASWRLDMSYFIGAHTTSQSKHKYTNTHSAHTTNNIKRPIDINNIKTDNNKKYGWIFNC